jgi:hypothetical protein
MMTLVQRRSGTSPFGALIQRAHGLLHFKNPSIKVTIRAQPATWPRAESIAPLGFIDPDFRRACGGNIIVLLENRVDTTNYLAG